LAFFLRYLLQGYIIFRGDQLTQIPLLYLLDDPTLFPRDAFLHQFTAGEARHFYLLLVRATTALLGLPFGLFFLYALFFGLTVWAWFLISGKVFESCLPGLFFALILAFHHVGKVAANDIVEIHILPRMVAYTCCWWAIYFAYLRERRLGAFLAGVVLGVGVNIHVLVPLQFWPILSLWLLIRRRREGVVPVLILGAVFLLLLVPSILKTQQLIGTYMTSTDPDSLILWAYVRNPHHIVLETWGSELVGLAALIVLWAIVWWPLRRTCREGWQFGFLAVVMVAVLTVSAVVMKFWPIEKLLVAQPFRLAVALRAAMYLMIGYHIAGLIRRQTFWAYARAAALVACGLKWELFLSVVIAETIITLSERYAPSMPRWTPGAILMAALVVACLREHGSDAPALLALGAAAVGCWIAPRPQFRSWLARRGLPISAAAGFVFLAAMWFLPFEKWIGNPDSPTQRRLARFCFDHALRPFPIDAIEKVGAWAAQNSPRDALFLIPPGKERAGFHVWAKRSALFNVKFFPYQPDGIKEWQERYLAVRGLTGASRSEIEAALRDVGAKHADQDYANLSFRQVLDLAATYRVGYVVSEHEPPYDSPELPIVFEARDSDSARSKPLRVYRVVNSRTTGSTGTK
jgi:hypothetical protein